MPANVVYPKTKEISNAVGKEAVMCPRSMMMFNFHIQIASCWEATYWMAMLLFDWQFCCHVYCYQDIHSHCLKLLLISCDNFLIQDVMYLVRLLLGFSSVASINCNWVKLGLIETGIVVREGKSKFENACYCKWHQSRNAGLVYWWDSSWSSWWSCSWWRIAANRRRSKMMQFWQELNLWVAIKCGMTCCNFQVEY